VIGGQAQVVCVAGVNKLNTAGRGGTPCEYRKHIQRGLQLRIKRLVHVPPSAWIVPYFAIDELSPLARTVNLFRRNILRWGGHCQAFV
jgi:hypothetical protein